MTEPDVTPDPVRATAPDAPPAPDDPPRDDEYVDSERVLPPVAPPRTG